VVHLLGIDVGSTVVKAVVFDASGGVVGSAARTVSVCRPRPGWIERDADATVRAAFAGVRAAVGGRGSNVVAVGVTGCGNGGILLDTKLRPIRCGILASDTRAAEFARKGEYPGQTSVLLRWLRARKPQVMRRLHRVAFWKDYVRLRLTDEFTTEPTDVGAAGFSPGSREPALPPCRASLAIAARITPTAARATGLRAGTPVMSGCLDCEAAAIGSGVAGPADLSIVAGTWAINQVFSARPPRPSGGLFLVNPSAQPGRWLVVEGSPNSASHFDWFVRAATGRADFARMAARAEASPHGDLLFVPGLFDRGGAFVGLKSSHDLGAMARAVMEGVCFAHRAHVEKLLAAGLRFRRARLAGGAARSPFWCQLFADTLGLPVAVPTVAEPGALGAALLAGVGAGVWPDLAAAQSATVRTARTFRPHNADMSVLARRYRHWLKVRRQLFP